MYKKFLIPYYGLNCAPPPTTTTHTQSSYVEALPPNV